MSVSVILRWNASDNPDSIWNRLAARLGREPTEQEASDEVKRILFDPIQGSGDSHEGGRS